MNKCFLVALCALTLSPVAMSRGQETPTTTTAIATEDLPILQEDSARVVLSTSKTEYVGGETIKLDITLKNAGTKSFRFLPLDADKFYQIEVINPDGKKAPLLGTYTRRIMVGGNGGVGPNSSKTIRAWLSNIFDMTMEGPYKITASKRFRLGNEVITVKSEPITIEVTSTPTISEWQ